MMSGMSSRTRYIMSWVIYESTLDWTIINTSEDSKVQYLIVCLTVVSNERIVQKAPLWSIMDPTFYLFQKSGKSYLTESLFGLFGYLFGYLFGSTDYNSYRLVECQELPDVHIHEISYVQEHFALKGIPLRQLTVYSPAAITYMLWSIFRGQMHLVFVMDRISIWLQSTQTLKQGL